MRKIFTILSAMLFTVGAFAATQPAWYNDVTSITANGQYYIFSVNGNGFVQENSSSLKTATATSAPSKWTISNPSGGTVKSEGGYYLRSYQTNSNTTNKSTTEGSAAVYETLRSNGKYWNIYGYYDYKLGILPLGTYFSALYYDNGYEATANLNSQAEQTDKKYQFYIISPAQYNRHWAIYAFDSYRETLNVAQFENLVPAAYYTALSELAGTSFNVQNAEHSAEIVNAAKTNLETLYTNAPAVAQAYADAKATINALDGLKDKGEDIVQITADITTARTAIEEAMTVEALNTAVTAPNLKAIDPITFSVTEFMAGKALGTPASTTAGRTITYDADDKTIINAAGQPIYKGTTKLTATAAATNDYYKFVRSAQVTVNAENTEAQESKKITYGDNVSWHGKDLSAYTVGQHTLTFDTLNVYGGAHKITLTLTVEKLPVLELSEKLQICEGDSVQFRGKWYYKAEDGEDIQVIDEIRDTVYTVVVTVNKPSYFTAEDIKMTYGDRLSWNGMALSDSTVGEHTLVYVTKNAVECDSTVTVKLIVSKQPVLEYDEPLEFCNGDSVQFRGKWYFKAEDSENIQAEGAIRDTVYKVTVTVHEPSATNETKTITEGDDETWNEIALKDSLAGTYTLVYTATNKAGCDSIVTLTLTVNPKENQGGTTGFENIQLDTQAVKEFRNGVMYIRRGEALYGLDGKNVE